MPRMPVVALLAALMLPAGLSAQTTPSVSRTESTSIPFVTHGNLRNFESAPDGRGIYIQNNRRDWYYARFFRRCLNLPQAIRIGFDTFGNGSSLQVGDTIIVERERCPIETIVRSGSPPKKAKNAKQG